MFRYNEVSKKFPSIKFRYHIENFTNPIIVKKELEENKLETIKKKEIEEKKLEEIKKNIKDNKLNKKNEGRRID